MRGLLARLLSASRAPDAAPAAVLPLPDAPLYAVGDIHGHLAKYDTLEAAILADARARGEDIARIVTLGDYVDRGPDSAGVLDRLAAPPPEGVERLCLRGNHEAMFEAFLARPDPRDPWLEMGGRETLASYGLYTDRVAARHFAQAVRALIPEDHAAFLAGLGMAAGNATHFLCHAGVDPARPLDAQAARDLMWIRAPFLDHGAPLARIVVHGHSPVAAPDLRGWRINVDTGAYSGGPLSAVRLAGILPPEIIQSV